MFLKAPDFKIEILHNKVVNNVLGAIWNERNLRWLVHLVQFSKKIMKQYPIFYVQIIYYQIDQMNK